MAQINTIAIEFKIKVVLVELKSNGRKSCRIFLK